MPQALPAAATSAKNLTRAASSGSVGAAASVVAAEAEAGAEAEAEAEAAAEAGEEAEAEAAAEAEGEVEVAAAAAAEEVEPRRPADLRSFKSLCVSTRSSFAPLRLTTAAGDAGLTTFGVSFALKLYATPLFFKSAVIAANQSKTDRLLDEWQEGRRGQSIHSKPKPTGNHQNCVLIRLKLTVQRPLFGHNTHTARVICFGTTLLLECGTHFAPTHLCDVGQFDGALQPTAKVDVRESGEGGGEERGEGSHLPRHQCHVCHTAPNARHRRLCAETGRDGRRCPIRRRVSRSSSPSRDARSRRHRLWGAPAAQTQQELLLLVLLLHSWLAGAVANGSEQRISSNRKTKKSLVSRHQIG